MDLLEYAKDLVARGNTTTQTQTHTAYLQTLIQSETPQPKAEVKATALNNSQVQPKNPNTYFLIGGLVLLIGSVLAIGY